MLTIFYSFPQLWATFASKLTKRPTIFFTCFQTSTLYLHNYNILWSPIYVNKNATCFNMSTKACIFQQLWTIFSTKLWKILIFLIFKLIFKFVSVLTLSRSFIKTTFLSKKWQLFQFCQQTVFYFKEHIFYLVFLKCSFVIYFPKYLQFPVNIIMH